jgi:hypothetical protein
LTNVGLAPIQPWLLHLEHGHISGTTPWVRGELATVGFSNH